MKINISFLYVLLEYFHYYTEQESWHLQLCFSSLFAFFEARNQHVAQAGLELTMQSWVVLNSCNPPASASEMLGLQAGIPRQVLYY